MRCIACVSGECWPENKSRKRRGCCAELRAGTGVRDLGCEAMLCSVPGWLLLSLLLLGKVAYPLCGALLLAREGACGLVTTRRVLARAEGPGVLQGIRRATRVPLAQIPLHLSGCGRCRRGSKRCWLAGCRCPQACPLGRRTAQRCANLQLRSLHSVLLKRMQSVLFPCLSCRLRMASVSAAALPSSFRRVCTLPPPFLPLPLLGLPLLPLPSLCVGGRARGCRSACTSALMHVISCNASSSVQPSARKLETSFQILRSACKSSCVFTVRRPVSAGSCCVQRSRIFCQMP